MSFDRSRPKLRTTIAVGLLAGATGLSAAELENRTLLNQVVEGSAIEQDCSPVEDAFNHSYSLRVFLCGPVELDLQDPFPTAPTGRAGAVLYRFYADHSTGPGGNEQVEIDRWECRSSCRMSAASLRHSTPDGDLDHEEWNFVGGELMQYFETRWRVASASPEDQALGMPAIAYRFSVDYVPGGGWYHDFDTGETVNGPIESVSTYTVTGRSATGESSTRDSCNNEQWLVSETVVDGVSSTLDLSIPQRCPIDLVVPDFPRNPAP